MMKNPADTASPCEDHDITAKAAEWYLRLREEDCSSEERDAFDTWLASSAEHEREYNKMLKIWELSERLVPTAAKEPPAALQIHHRQRPASSIAVFSAIQWLPTTWRSALTSLIVVAFVGYGGWMLNWIPNDYRYYASGQERRQVTLPDGTHVELNLRTRIHYTNYRDRRQATLFGSGEAFFEVSHDQAHPFRVAAGAGTIQVTGTEFNVWKYQDSVSVTVSDGSVKVSSSGMEADLLPGMQAEYGAALKQPLVRSADMRTALAWRSGSLVFDDLTLAEAAPQINRYLDHPIILADSAVASMRIGGIYRTHNIKALVTALPDILPIAMRKRFNGSLVLSECADCRASPH